MSAPTSNEILSVLVNCEDRPEEWPGLAPTLSRLSTEAVNIATDIPAYAPFWLMTAVVLSAMAGDWNRADEIAGHVVSGPYGDLSMAFARRDYDFCRSFDEGRVTGEIATAYRLARVLELRTPPPNKPARDGDQCTFGSYLGEITCHAPIVVVGLCARHAEEVIAMDLGGDS